MSSFLSQILEIPTAFAQQTGEKANATPQAGDHIQNLVDTLIRMFPLWITGGIVIIISFLLARTVRSAVENKMTEKGLEEEHREIQIVAGRSASAAVLTIGVTVGLKIAGLDLTTVLAAAAFGIGFAMKDLIMNFIAGIIVLLQKQFTIGDWIKVKGTVGVIQQIQSRYTVIKSFDGTKVIIPNADLFKNQVTSLTSNPFRRFKLNLDVDLYYDLKEVIDVIYGSIKKVSRILQHPKPSIIVTQPGAYANKLMIRCWVDSKKGTLKATSALIRQIHKDFYKRGWSWPYPTQNLIFDKDVQPDVNARAKEYREKYKKNVKKPAAIVAERLPNETGPLTISIPAPTSPEVMTVAAPQQVEQNAQVVPVTPLVVEQNLSKTALVQVPPIAPAPIEPINAVLPLPDVDTKIGA